MDDIKSVNLKSEIFNLIELKIKDPLLGFDSVDEYVNHILKKALDINDSSKGKSEDELVEEKLKQLGYI
jgi:hypothetical protein